MALAGTVEEPPSAELETMTGTERIQINLLFVSTKTLNASLSIHFFISLYLLRCLSTPSLLFCKLGMEHLSNDRMVTFVEGLEAEEIQGEEVVGVEEITVVR